MTGVSNLILRRAALPLNRNIGCRAGRANVHAVGLTSSHQSRPMFGRAVEAKKAAAANQPSRTPANNVQLAKQLFPSSSPSPAPKREENTITNMWGKKLHTSAMGRPPKPAETTKPLQNRPLNVPPPVPREASSKSFASIVSNSDSFKEEPDLRHDGPRLSSTASHTNNQPFPEGWDLDDLSDDENLDLEFQSVSALPQLPTNPPKAATKDRDEPPPATDTSVLSWSQSSPSHLQPPPRVAPPRQPKSVKRSSPDDDDESVHKGKKKRQLPWSKSEDHGLMDRYGAAAATPAPKSKEPAPWNTTASAVKAQKKQLKSQLKESEKVEASLDDMQEAAKAHRTKTAAISLSNEQRHVKNLVVEKGQSVFFTGPAGTGKSVLMRAIIQELKKKYARDPERVAVTASTGLAACNIGGMTLHSFAGIGLGKEDTNTLVKKIRRNPKAKNRWLKVKVLIIDEVSMVDGELFDKLSQIGRIIRNNGRPWGGIQLVITGDFFQLPPVPEGGKQREAKFAFDAATWSMSIDHTIGLTEVFRQRDPEFAAMLNEMRLGKISDETVRSFQALSRPLNFNDGLEVTELFPTRQEVDSSNQRRLKALPGKVYRYDAVDEGDIKIRDRLLANMMAPPSIELKEGAQVMLIKNMDETLVNGSLGTVVDFMSMARFELQNGGLEGDSDDDSDTKRRVRAFNNALSEASSKGDDKKYPMVAFHAVDGTQRRILCLPEDWKVQLPTGETQAARRQVPLILAWALSIHKAQGQTLERVKVDLGKVFEKGQAYVALSRATSKQGLQVLNFQKHKVMAHPRVVEFYNKLYSAESAVKKKPVQGQITSYAVKQEQGAEGSARNPVSVFDEDEEEAMAAYG